MKQISKITESTAKDVAKKGFEAFTNENGRFAVHPSLAADQLDPTEFEDDSVEDNVAATYVQLTYDAAANAWPIRRDKKMFPL